MNELDHASLEASKRLVEVGIILKTEFCWAPPVFGNTEKYVHRCFGYLPSLDCIPCPLFTEVWKELPDHWNWKSRTLDLLITKESGYTVFHYSDLARNHTLFRSDDINPTDAAIGLLIWTKSNKP